MSTKNVIRTLVVAGIVTWPTVETYRLWSTSQKMLEAQALERSVSAKLASVRANKDQVAKVDPSPAPSSKP